MAPKKTKTDEEKEEPVPATNTRKIKYLGDSDNRIINQGETFNGQYPDGLPTELCWSWANQHLIEVDLPPDALALLLEDPEFRDVTDMSRVPAAAVAQRRHGVGRTLGALNPTGTAQVPTSATGSPGGTTLGGSTP